MDEQTQYNGARVVATPTKKTEQFLPKINGDTAMLYSYLQHWFKVLQAIEEKLKVAIVRRVPSLLLSHKHIKTSTAPSFSARPQISAEF